MEGKIKYQFSAKMWRHNSEGSWFFITIPKKISEEIISNLKWLEEGWGRMKVIVQVAELKWHTSIWFDTKLNGYVLPIKSSVRKKISLKENDRVTISISV